MNKKSILTALLALVAMTGQAQVKSGLDLCLRDEATGEWLIGLFNEFAVYDCEYWDYAKVDTVKGDFVLVNGCERLDLKLKDGVLKINKKKHQVTKLTERTLPDYPTKDESDFINSGYLGGKATLRGRLINVPKGHEDRVMLHVPDLLQTVFDDDRHVDRDSLGRFEFTIELANTGEVSLLWANLILTPGNTYYILMDGATGRTYVMGRDARLSNELLAHDIPYYKVNRSDFDNKTDAELLEAVNKDMQRVQAVWERTEQSVPMLSKRYRQLSRWQWKMGTAHSLVQRRYDNPDIRKSEDGRLWQWLRENVFDDFAQPYTLVQSSLGYTLNNYTTELLRPRQHSVYSFEFIEATIDIVENKGKMSMDYMDSLRTLRQQMNDYRAKTESGTPDSLLTDHPFTAMIEQMFAKGSLLMQVIKSSEPEERVLLQNISRIDSLCLSDELKDLSQAIAINAQLEQKHGPLSDALRKVMEDIVDNPYYRQRIGQRSDYYAALVAKLQRGNGCLMSNEPLKGLTDGKEILGKILEPYRGRVVYLDVWGTWCVPCKANLKHYTKPMLETLHGLPITYLYLCNNSSDEAWRSVIGEYELTSEHSVHYNLPNAQQAAVEEYLGIRHYPTYLLFDPQGNRQPEEYRPHNLEALREAIDKLSK
jgi:thiol-disulfide isomerase/thioredoxin